MKQRNAWAVYIVLRLLFFAVPFIVLYLIGWPWWLALVTSALIALSLSILLLQRPRDAASESIYEWRQRTRTADDIVEDASIDAMENADNSAKPEPEPEADADTTPEEQR